MNIIVQSCIQTLTKSKVLLGFLSDETLKDHTVSPYYSSIGSHIRHILDFYDCIFNINPGNEIDLTKRSRNRAVEFECNSAIEYLNFIIEKLKRFEYNMNDTILVYDDL
tara:strand:- start:7223 stop:7549 length:327 start_codon:yes stop_codon:yes gene_type:complete